MKLQKIVLYIESNQDGTIGGSHHCLLELIKKLDREIYTPIVYFYQDNSLVNEFRQYCQVIIKNSLNGIIIRNTYPSVYALFSKNNISHKLIVLAQKIYNYMFSYIPYYGHILYLLYKHKVDFIHMNDVPVLTQWLVSAKLSGVVCISHIRGNWNPTQKQKLLSRFYDCFITISDSVTDLVIHNGIDATKIVKIYDGIDTKNVLAQKTRSRESVREELHLSNEEFTVGVVGNIKRWKGQHIAIEAIEKLCKEDTNIKCLIIGDTSLLNNDRDYYDYLKQYVKENNLSENIIFLGYRSDVPDIIASLDALLLTSTDPEPLGRVVFEGMLFEKPVIATAHGGPAEIIRDGITGYLVQPNNAKMLSDKIKYIIHNSESAECAGKNARRDVEKYYDISVTVRSIQEIYAQYN